LGHYAAADLNYWARAIAALNGSSKETRFRAHLTLTLC